MNRHLRTLALGAAGVLFVAACGSDSSVGDESNLAFDQDNAPAFGATTTVATTSTTLVPTTVAPATTAPATTAAPTTTTTLPPEQQEVSIEVKILDTSPYFDPSVAAVPVGGKIRFLNTGTGTYSVLSDNGAFDSGPIAPGAVWIYDANTPGQFNYSDGGRPFAVGQFQVVS